MLVYDRVDLPPTLVQSLGNSPGQVSLGGEGLGVKLPRAGWGRSSL
jgi:hypothetical protein